MTHIRIDATGKVVAGDGKGHYLNLMALNGPMTLRELQRQLKCQRCRKSRAAVVLDDETWIGRD